MRAPRPLTAGLVAGCLAPLVGLSGAAGCASSDADTSVDGLAESSESIALVALTWRSDAAASGAASGLAQVYVVDHQAGRRPAALELLSMPAAAEVLDTSLGLGECRVDRPRGNPGAVVLRDAGEIAVEGDLGVSVLDSSWLPEDSLDISGVAYAGLLGPRSTRDARRPLQVVADGSPEVGPFTVQLTPPPALRLVSIGGHDVVKGRVQLNAGELAQHLEITWDPTPMPDDGDTAVPAGSPPGLLAAAASDLTVVVFERRSFGATWTISCVASTGSAPGLRPDEGRFTIPAGALLALPDLGADRTDSVVVRRIASTSFAAKNVAEGMALAVSEDQAYVE